MVNPTPCPQSVVVPVEPTEAIVRDIASQLSASIADLGFPVGLGVAPPDEMCLKAARGIASLYGRPLAAAPAPSSLAGGALERAARLIDPKAWEFADKFSTGPHAETMRAEVKYETAASLRIAGEVLAALSPEAPAREGGEPWKEGREEGRLAARPWRKGDPEPAVGSMVLVSGAHGDIDSDQHRAFSWRRVIGYGVDGDDFICLQNKGCWPTVERMENCWFAALTPRHEAPAALCDHGHTDPMALCSDCEASSVEAPAEGAGERECLAVAIDPSLAGTDFSGLFAEGSRIGKALAAADRILALRARSSAPEAREGEVVAWLYETVGGKKTASVEPLSRINGHKVYGQPLFTAPSADKLRIAVEAMLPVARSNTRIGKAGAELRAHLDTIRQALAALKAETRK